MNAIADMLNKIHEAQVCDASKVDCCGGARLIKILIRNEALRSDPA
jgi:hypothetical protein